MPFPKDSPSTFRAPPDCLPSAVLNFPLGDPHNPRHPLDGPPQPPANPRGLSINDTYCPQPLPASGRPPQVPGGLSKAAPPDASEGGEVPPPPLQGAQPRPSHSSMASATDSNRPQPLWQPPPTACLTASGAASEVPSPLMHLCPPTPPFGTPPPFIPPPPLTLPPFRRPWGGMSPGCHYGTGDGGWGAGRSVPGAHAAATRASPGQRAQAAGLQRGAARAAGRCAVVPGRPARLPAVSP